MVHCPMEVALVCSTCSPSCALVLIADDDGEVDNVTVVVLGFSACLACGSPLTTGTSWMWSVAMTYSNESLKPPAVILLTGSFMILALGVETVGHEPTAISVRLNKVTMWW